MLDHRKVRKRTSRLWLFMVKKPLAARAKLPVTAFAASFILDDGRRSSDECRCLVGEMRPQPRDKAGNRARRHRPSLLLRFGGARAANRRAPACAWIPARRPRRH